MLYEYSFSVWPDEQGPRVCREVCGLFRMMLTRVVMEFEPREFRDFREEIAKFGLTLREVTRRPAVAEETVLE